MISAGFRPSWEKSQFSYFCAINGKQVTVTFNSDVTTAGLTKANFTVTQAGDAAGKDRFTEASATNNIGTVDTGILQVAGKTATLTMDQGAIFTNGKTITILTTGVKNGGETVADITKTAVLSDTTAPTIVSAISTGSKEFKVIFSEPVYDGTNDNTTFDFKANNFMINDGGVAVATAKKDAADPNAVVVTTSSDLVVGTTYTVKVNYTANSANVQDYVGYKVIANSTVTFKHVVDTNVPNVTAVAKNEKVVRLTFDRPVVMPSSTNVEFRYAYNATGAIKTTAATGQAVVLNTNNTQYDITLPSAMTPGSGQLFITYLVAADSTKSNVIKDAYGNVLPSGTAVTFTVVNDTNAPTAVVEYKTATTIDVTFNKTVTGAQTTGNYTLKDPKGNAVAISGIAVQGAATDNKYRLTVADMSAGGNFTLAISDGIKDTTVNQNKFVAQTFTVAVPDTKAPTVATTGVVANNATVSLADVLYVYCSEDMGTSALDASNYRLVAGSTQYVLPSNTTITQTGSTIKIQLPKTLAAYATDLGSAALTDLYLGGIKDLAGNTVNPMGNRTIQTAANFTATVSKVTVNSGSQVSFIVNRQLKAVDASLIAKNGGAAAQSVSFVNNTDGTATITANFAASTFGTTAAGAVDVSALALTDLNDIKNAAVTNQTVTIDRAAPQISTSTVPVTTGTAGNITSIDVVYSENIYPASVTASDYTVEGYTITGVNVTTTKVEVQVAKQGSYDSGATPKVTQVGEVEDAITINADQPTRNILGAQSAITPLDKVVPVVVSAIGSNKTAGVASTIEAGDKITVTFSEATNKPALTDASFTIAGGHTLDLANAGSAVWNADGTVLTITLGTTSTIANADTIAFAAASTVTDAAAAPNNFGTGTFYTVVATQF